MIARPISRRLPFASRHHARSGAAAKWRRTAFALLWVAVIAPGVNTVYAQTQSYALETIAEDLQWPWSFALLPDGSFLVTEREGRLLHVGPGRKRTTVTGTPDTLFAGQGGYFDIVLHPRFEETQWVFLSYAAGDERSNRTTVLRARYEDDQLVDGKTILSVKPDKSTPQHYGGRLLFLRDESLLVTSGEGFEHREQAQSLDSELGKVLRIDVSGNPGGLMVKGQKSRSRIWSYGHRNPQGIVLIPDTGEVLLHEHGPRGGDELNLVERGANYGWPLATYGVDYSGAYVSPFQRVAGMQEPLWKWVPSIAPSGMAWYNGARFPGWRNSLFIGALVDREVRRLEFFNGVVQREEALFPELDERIRDVRVFDDRIFILTDGEQGRLVEVLPRWGS